MNPEPKILSVGEIVVVDGCEYEVAAGYLDSRIVELALVPVPATPAPAG